MPGRAEGAIRTGLPDAPQLWEGSAESAEDTEAQAGSGENGLLSTWTMSSVLGTPRHPSRNVEARV